MRGDYGVVRGDETTNGVEACKGQGQERRGDGGGGVVKFLS